MQGSKRVERFQKKNKFKEYDYNNRKSHKPNRDKPSHKRWEENQYQDLNSKQ